MTLLDLHFRTGKVRTIREADYCTIGFGCLYGFDSQGRLILRVRLEGIDYIEVRVEADNKRPRLLEN